jgi:hypothetical protein
VFYLDVAKVDLVLHKLQWDPPTAGHRRVCVTVMHMRRASTGGRMDSCVRETKQAWAGHAYTQEVERAKRRKGAVLVAREKKQHRAVCACASESCVCVGWDWEPCPDMSCAA